MNELVDLNLTSSALKKVTVDSEENKIHIEREATDTVGQMVDSAESFGAFDNDQKRAYWALRSMSSGFVIPLVVHRMLYLLRKNGYRYIAFVRPEGEEMLELSLDAFDLGLFSIIPTIKVTHTPSPEIKSDNVVHFVNIVDGHVIDLTAGSFWAFDREERPMLIAHRKFYRPMLGELGEKTENIDKIIEEFKAKPHIKHHSASLLNLLMPLYGFSWKTHRMPELKDVTPLTQKQALQMNKDFGNKDLINAFGVYLNECDTPVTRILRDIHKQMYPEVYQGQEHEEKK